MLFNSLLFKGGFMCQNHYGFYFHVISRLLKSIIDDTLKNYDLTKSQSDIIRFLCTRENEITTQKDIETYFQISNPTVTGLLNRLEQKQFIQRMDHPFDKRAKQIVLTQKGWEVHTAVENQIEENEKILLEGFSESEKEIYLDFLKKSLNNLSKEVKKC